MDGFDPIELVKDIARRSSFTASSHNADRDYKNVDDASLIYGIASGHRDQLSRYDLTVLSKEQLLVLLGFSNTIMSQSLPVKCIFLTLKSLKTNLSAELVEICYPDKETADWVVHSVGKDGILHKKSIPYLSEGAHYHAFTSGAFVRIDDCNGNPMYNMQFDRHTDLELQNLLICPLFDSKHSVWGLASIANRPFTMRSPSNNTISSNLQSPLSEARMAPLNSEVSSMSSTASTTTSYSDCRTMTFQNDLSSIDECVCHTEAVDCIEPLDLMAYRETAPSLHDDGGIWDISTLTLALQMCDIGGQCISNAIGWRHLDATREKADGLMTLMHSIFADKLGIQSCVVALTTHAKKLMQAERCTVYIVDQTHEQLWSISSDDGSQIVVPLSHGCAGVCAATGESIAIDNTYEDPRFDSEFDSRAGVEMRNVAWVPIKSADCTRSLAVIEVINKQAEELLHFDEEDIRLLEIFAAIVGPQLERSDFALSVSRPAETEAGLAFKTVSQTLSSAARQHVTEPCIPETEEE
ncbi:GAF-like domain containing protein [Babesia gibsoni]|uniref:GAF-like domain containing protein n=1 Tax=Babesia gibsoni TaxID=33632 RepID=A0AAD8LPZ7_BABGI|nr:GAF-like domain containing protein [Babesia gibsoni]